MSDIQNSKKLSYLSNADPGYIDSLYHSYLQNPDLVDFGWQKFFEGFQFGRKAEGGVTAVDESVLKEIKVLNLIHAYRTRGHLFTQTNPVRERRKYSPTLDLPNFGLSDNDLDTVFHAGTEISLGPATLRDIIAHLKTTYCRSIGVEFMFIREPDTMNWLKKRMEASRNLPKFSKSQKLHILRKLAGAVLFENFLHTKYVGQKSFALSGGETLIPALDIAVEQGAEMGVEEFVIGMAHRGRINVLANILGKPAESIFAEFEGLEPGDSIFAGDVKYHLGYSSDVLTVAKKKVHLSLTPNPSHLEAVDPVTEGIARAKIDHRYNGNLKKIVPIMIHGDSAIAAQGVVYEVIQMSKLEGYRTGGTIHLVINNQVGFTTNYLDARSSTYCTDVGKVTLSPVFHVNADDVEAVVFAVLMALDYRQEFHTDVFIDLLGYRRYGHNEADEPRFTQPKLYKNIARHPDPHIIYQKKLIEENVIDEKQGKEVEREYKDHLTKSLEVARGTRHSVQDVSLSGDWKKYRHPRNGDFEKQPKTGVDAGKLLDIGEKILTIPEEVKVFAKIRRMYEARKKKLLEDRMLDWTLGEYLAYGTLLTEGHPIRLSGEDSERGTFAHRHSVLLVEDTEEEYVPLNNISGDQAKFCVYNSLLSEYGVLGFEFGYAWARPDGLSIWEAQFGDFANGAQIIVDQYLSCSEDKWHRMSGLVLYLPHGYEGQGPEHSSARMERYLTLSANLNWQVVNCTTPANLFHVLRRQMKFPFRIPLIIFTPKSLLRHPKAVSPLADLEQPYFREVIDDPSADPEKIERLLFCTGKVYYDLLQYQEEQQREDVAIVRLEQIYPLPKNRIKIVLEKYRQAENFIWVQEEPENMGALPYLQRKFRRTDLEFVSRPESATPATGNHKKHLIEQQKLIEAAFGKKKTTGKSTQNSKLKKAKKKGVNV